MPLNNPSSGTGTGIALQRTITQTTHGFVVGNWLYFTGTSYALADNDTVVAADSIGVISAVVDANNFSITTHGYVTGLAGLTPGSAHFISDIAGAITATEPSSLTQTRKPVLIADTTTSGYVIDRSGTPTTTTEALSDDTRYLAMVF